MGLYVVRRVAQGLAFILVAWLLVYTVLVVLMPGGPGSTYNTIQHDGGNFGQAFYLANRYKVDKPWPVNFFAWLFDPADTTQFVSDQYGNPMQVPQGIDVTIGEWRLQGSGLLTLDFGYTDSLGNDGPVGEMLSDRWPNTALLLAASMLLAVAVSLPVGIASAVRHRSRLDHTLTLFSFAGFSIPPYLLGVFLVIGLAVLPYIWRNQYGWTWLPYLPAGFVADEGQTTSVPNRLWHIVLPAVTLALPQIAFLSRYVRSSMLEVLRQDYIRTAWAKGLRARRVVLRHALRNSMIPFITMIGVLVPALAAGSIIVENVFSYQGIGQLYFRALGGCVVDTQPCSPTGYPMDYPLALVLTFLLIVVVAVANLVADIAYTVVDPRIEYA